jgi:excisionase family DNA binding protein
MRQPNAQAVFDEFRKLPRNERARFYELLGESSVHDDNLSHEQVFGHLANEAFSASDAANYLEISISTFRRYVADGKINASSEIGRNQLFSTKDLKAFKRSRRQIKGAKALVAGRKKARRDTDEAAITIKK